VETALAGTVTIITELLVLPDQLIADRRLQEVTVFIDPGLEGKRRELRHGDHLQGENSKADRRMGRESHPFTKRDYIAGPTFYQA
jgi:hypothetical protein